MTAEGEMHHYRLSGLDYVYLVNGFTRHETEYGPGIAFDDLDGLHRAIGEDIITHRAHLSGAEVRFLRKEMDLSQGGLAVGLGVDAQTVARWEKGQTDVPGPADRLIRVLYREHVGGSPEIGASSTRWPNSTKSSMAGDASKRRPTAGVWQPERRRPAETRKAATAHPARGSLGTRDFRPAVFRKPNRPRRHPPEFTR